MNTPQVISVNPGSKTVGERLQEARKYEPVVQSIVTRLARKPKAESVMNALTGIPSKTSKSTTRRLFLLRFVTSLILGALAYYSWYTGHETILIVPLIVMAGSLLTGFLTRILSVGLMATFIYLAVQGMAAPVISGALAFTALVFAILGPGRYSADQLIRHSIVSIAKRRQRHAPTPLTSSHLKFDYRSYSRLS